MASVASIYDIKIEGIDGKRIDLAAFKGKKILIVNTASECGYTPQYGQLEELYRSMTDKLVVLGCPCNDFGQQEPGTAAEIQKFCSTRFDVTFPLTAKIHVQGEQQHSLYRWLTTQPVQGVQYHEITWNFFKFLVDETGQLEAIYPSGEWPLNEDLLQRLS